MFKTHGLYLGILTAAVLQAATNYKVVDRIPIPGDGGFDYITLDAPSRRIYLSHGVKVDVVDADSGKILGTLMDTPGVHGIAIATPFKRGFTSNGAENKVSMFDPSTLQVLKKIDVGQGPDGIYYEPASKRIFTNNHGSHDITAIDASSGNVVGTVKIEGDGEQTIIGSDGLIYVNSENTNEVVVFDPKSLRVVRRFPIGVATTPTGLAYDPSTKRLFIACRNQPRLVVMDAQSGKAITSLPIGAGADWADFDTDSRSVFVSTGEGVLNIVHEKSRDEYESVGAVKTQPGAKTMAFDHMTKKIFLPTAEYQMAPSGEPGKQQRRTVKPGSFVLLVLTK